jgi:hypothetical protein
MEKAAKLTETRVESGGVCAFCESSSSVVLRHHGEAEGEPESAERTEDDEREGVANDPLWSVSI